MQTKAKKLNCVGKFGYSVLSVEASAKHLVVKSSQCLLGETEDMNLQMVIDKGEGSRSEC